jgi:hypothetical protein
MRGESESEGWKEEGGERGGESKEMSERKGGISEDESGGLYNLLYTESDVQIVEIVPQLLSRGSEGVWIVAEIALVEQAGRGWYGGAGATGCATDEPGAWWGPRGEGTWKRVNV